jgi:hypothetical protein
VTQSLEDRFPSFSNSPSAKSISYRIELLMEISTVIEGSEIQGTLLMGLFVRQAGQGVRADQHHQAGTENLAGVRQVGSIEVGEKCQ